MSETVDAASADAVDDQLIGMLVDRGLRGCS
jgi:hypothetical protein